MITKLRGLLFPLLFACTAAHAQAPKATEEQGSPNHFFFHPIITIITLAVDELPLVLQVTYERNLRSPGNSLIWQPQLTLGEAKSKDDSITIRFSQYGTTQYLGLRHYFGTGYGGFYLQASGKFAFSFVSAQEEGNPDKASGTIEAFGGLAYAGYKWSHVFLDFGLGYQGVQGNLSLDSGEEVTVAETGPSLDFNLGFGF